MGVSITGGVAEGCGMSVAEGGGVWVGGTGVADGCGGTVSAGAIVSVGAGTGLAVLVLGGA